MLVLKRSTRLSLHARALSTAVHSTGFPNTDAEEFSNDDPASALADAKPRRQKRFAHSNIECMLVHPWNQIRSSAEGFAIAKAIQDKYGPAKEVVFSRNTDSISIFQPYFWLIYDDPNVTKRLPEESGQIALRVPDLPRSDCNVGLEEMMRGLGLYTTDNQDPNHSSPPPTETDLSRNASDEPPEGYKTIKVHIELADTAPREVFHNKHAFGSHPLAPLRRDFAKAWLAFDGFSHESARGSQTPNLFRVHEKWRKLAPQASARTRKDDKESATTAAAVSPSSQEIDVEEVEAETEPMTETGTNEVFSREWVPITPSMPYSQPRPRPKRDSAPSKNIRYEDIDIFNVPTPPNPDQFPFNAALAAAEAAASNPTTDAPSTEEPAAKQAQATGRAKLNRRERILQLARQNARTPLPKLPEKPQPPPEAEKTEESERQGKERTIRERLWRLVGGNF